MSGPEPVVLSVIDSPDQNHSQKGKARQGWSISARALSKTGLWNHFTSVLNTMDAMIRQSVWA